MHTTETLRSDQFRVIDAEGHAHDLATGLTSEDRLGIISPRYEDAVLDAGGAILLFITAFYDVQRARQRETGEPFFIYPDYFVFLFARDQGVLGRAGAAALGDGVSAAYGKLDVWPDEKWVMVRDVVDLWEQVRARQITHLLLPDEPAFPLGPIPAPVASTLRATYRYLPADGTGSPDAFRIEMATEPRAMIATALGCLPESSPARSAAAPSFQRLVSGSP